MIVSNKFTQSLDGLYDRLHIRVAILISLILALSCGALVIWDPSIFAQKLGGFNIVNGLALIWATCAGLIHGLSFKPHFWLWQLFFFPPLAWLIMGWALITAYL